MRAVETESESPLAAVVQGLREELEEWRKLVYGPGYEATLVEQVAEREAAERRAGFEVVRGARSEPVPGAPRP